MLDFLSARVPTAVEPFAAVNVNAAGLAAIADVATTGAGGGGGGASTTGGGGGVTVEGAGGGGGGNATGEAVTVNVIGTRSMFVKLLGPESTMYTTAE